MEKIIIGYVIVINIIGFYCMGRDKKKAIRHQYRIPEKTFFSIAIIGGVIGCILGMQYFRHKTKHLSFTLGMPFIMIIQLVLIYWIGK